MKRGRGTYMKEKEHLLGRKRSTCQNKRGCYISEKSTYQEEKGHLSK